jgi:flagellin
MLTINTQTPLLGAQNDLNRTQGPLQTAMERMASGKKVNSAADNAAALAIAAQLAEQLLGGNQGIRNLNDGISLLQTAEGGLGEINDSVQRMRELAVQSNNGILSDSDRAALQTEMGELQEQVAQAIDSTDFNGTNPFRQNGSLEFQAGADEGDRVSVSTRELQDELDALGLFGIDISTTGGADSALSVLDQAADLLIDFRGELGASQNRFESAVRNLEQQNLDTAAAGSRIMDTDYAKAAADMSRNLILQNANLAMQSQANVSAGLVGRLLGIGD